MSDPFPPAHSTNVKIAALVKAMLYEATVHEAVVTRLRDEAGALESICLGGAEPSRLHSEGLIMSRYAVAKILEVSTDRINSVAATLALIEALKSELLAGEAEFEEPSLFFEVSELDS